jgi:hypothetical protein
MAVQAVCSGWLGGSSFWEMPVMGHNILVSKAIPIPVKKRFFSFIAAKTQFTGF